MPLFGSNPLLPDDMRVALAEDKGSIRRIIAKGQDDIRASLLDGETVSLIVVEHYTATRTIVMTDLRALVMLNGGRRLEKVLAREDIRDVRLSGDPGGPFHVMIDGAGTVVRFHDQGIARALTNRIRALVGPPRSIPVLFPDYYTDMLATAGMPSTPTNIVNLIERVFFMVKAQAFDYFEQADDTIATRQFTHLFADGGPDERTLHVVDDMVDWLWLWSPFCHDALDHSVPRIRELLLQPGSILHNAEGRVPSWSEWTAEEA